MRKLLLLPAIGAAAALTYGAAAALNVTGSAPIQVGTVNDLQCAESAEVSGWGYDDAGVTVSYAWVDVTDVGGDCSGNVLYVTPLSDADAVLPTNNGEYATGHVILGDLPIGQTTDRDGDVSRYKVNFGYTTGTSKVSALDLERVRISIDQGPGVGPLMP
jgi:hypothetical protein